MENRNSEWLREAKIVSKILSNAPVVDKERRIGSEEFSQRQPEVETKIGKKIDLVRMKPYTGTHNRPLVLSKKPYRFYRKGS